MARASRSCTCYVQHFGMVDIADPGASRVARTMRVCGQACALIGAAARLQVVAFFGI